MRAWTLGVVLSVAMLSPEEARAQAYAFGPPQPEVTAGQSEWLRSGEPIIVEGLIYYPTQATRLWDPSVMVQTSVYRGVPIYADVTIQPFSRVYVPVTRSLMTEYERKRQGLLAGTTGSRTPHFPVDVASDTVLERELQDARLALLANATGTAGESVPQPTSTVGTAPVVVRPRPTRMESIPAPAGRNGVWLEFGGARWYSDGDAVPFSADRFEPIGDYRGFPVYREKRGRSDTIWVSALKDGPIAPYKRR
jgi:hypothetical protein